MTPIPSQPTSATRQNSTRVRTSNTDGGLASGPRTVGVFNGCALAAVSVAALALLASCSEDDGPATSGAAACLNGVQADCKPVAELVSESKMLGQVSSEASSLSSTLVLEVGSVATGKNLKKLVTFGNSGNVTFPAGYRIKSVRMEYAAGSPEEGDVKSLECWNADGTKRCEQMDSQWRLIVPKGYSPKTGQTTTENFVIQFNAFDNKPRTGVVQIELVGIAASTLTFHLNVVAKTGAPKANLAPKDLNFATVPPKQCATEKVQLLNSGDAVLAIDAINLMGIDKSFQMRLTDPADVDSEWHAGGAVWTLAKQLQVLIKGSAEFEVKFCPPDDKKKQGQIKFVGNDSSAPALSVLANSSVPCIHVDPKSLSFGGAIPGLQSALTLTLENCGSQELVINELQLTEDTADANQEFFIDQSGLATSGKLKAPPPLSPQNPLKLGINEKANVIVLYAPADITPANSKDTATIKVISNAYTVPVVKLEGVGVQQICPVAKVKVAEGGQVIPQTTLHLNGSSSVAPGGGQIKKYKWTVKQPQGSNQPLLPSANFPNPTLQANTAGDYTFCLNVWDQNDVISCDSQCATVQVLPTNAIHIELLWDTPSDPDQVDSGPAAGADLDLHFAHPLASGLDHDCDGVGDPWFSNPWDTFWFNPKPSWGAVGTTDDPTLDLDDTDGAGPENLNVEESEGSLDQPVAYSIGVHYWNDHGFGTSYATVSIYLQGALALQFTKVKMDPLDMWYVGKLNWPNTMSGGPKKPFDTCYQSGQSCTAGKNLMWQPKGDWCITKCYEDKAFVQTVGGAAAGTCKKGP